MNSPMRNTDVPNMEMRQVETLKIAKRSPAFQPETSDLTLSTKGYNPWVSLEKTSLTRETINMYPQAIFFSAKGIAVRRLLRPTANNRGMTLLEISMALGMATIV